MPKVDNAIDKVGGRNEKTKHLFSFTIFFFFFFYQNFIKFLFYLIIKKIFYKMKLVINN